MRILVADDDPTCRVIVARLLSDVGDIDVQEAEDGDTAWSLLKRSSFDGAILDWQMPGKTGLEIVRAIRAARLKIPLFMMSGESEKERVIEAIQAGITDYLIKPFDAETLEAKLNKFVELTRLRKLCIVGVPPASPVLQTPSESPV